MTPPPTISAIAATAATTIHSTFRFRPPPACGCIGTVGGW
ncbi:hypothetical protein QFZ63_004651 [Streptomyces sp. B3I7]|nr:hypothetical protein [Streptomyces sp. B3I7]